nr:alpha/beta hydrolase [Herbaspirillum sp. YR522]
MLYLVFAGQAWAQHGLKEYSAMAPDGVALAIQEGGNPQGPPVVFIHGLLGSHLNWQGQFSDTELQKYRLISYDLRGHGKSGKPGLEDAYKDGRIWAADLAAVIEAAHAEGAVLVGWSLGGVVISNYLAAYGDAKLSGTVYVDGVVELNADQIAPHPQVYKDMISPDLRTHLDGERTFLELCFNKKPDEITFARLLANASMASWAMQKAVQSMSVFAAEGIGRAKVPMLFLYGGKDVLVNTEPTIARARKLNPDIRSFIYRDSGHAPFIEEAVRFNADLKSFLSDGVGR